MQFNILPNGNLEITADEDDREALTECDNYPDRETILNDAVDVDGWRMVDPADIGALTEAPIICDDNWTVTDDGNFETDPETLIWWFPNYMVIDPTKELQEKGKVVFALADVHDRAGMLYDVYHLETGEHGEQVRVTDARNLTYDKAYLLLATLMASGKRGHLHKGVHHSQLALPL